MRRFLVLLLLSSLIEYPSFAQEECASYNYHQQEILSDADFLKKTKAIELFLTNRLHNRERVMSPAGSGGSAMTVIKIPVVIHVLFNNNEQKITEEQVQSQIQVLNKAFRALNDKRHIPEHFRPLASDCFIEFTLATVDPQGKPARGILWKRTNVTSFGSDDKIKFSRHGGDDAWDADKYLNIWVARLSPGIIGYSSAPGCPKEKDGIVLRYTAMGTTGAVAPPYNLGGTAIHEIGHWLGLKHIWGDRYCGDDGIQDTPPQKGPTRGCPAGPVVSCDNKMPGSMYMNYMDIAHDACTSMFTAGQRDRMRALFVDGGPRHALLLSPGASGPGLPVATETPSDEPEVISFGIFPNPASTTLTISTGKNNYPSVESITIHNQLGQVIMQAFTTSTTTAVDISRLKKGLYFIRVGSSDKVYKMIKY